jgi:hypothetical protein
MASAIAVLTMVVVARFKPGRPRLSDFLCHCLREGNSRIVELHRAFFWIVTAAHHVAEDDVAVEGRHRGGRRPHGRGAVPHGTAVPNPAQLQTHAMQPNASSDHGAAASAWGHVGSSGGC